MDTVYMMPGDTFAVPVATRDRTGGAPMLTFGPSPDAATYAIDANGKITGVGTGGAVRTDLYLDPLGSEAIRGTFVAPLRTRLATCQ